MKYLINPAVSLMNRLPMVYKFSLISILFLGPIIVLSWLVISSLNQSVQTMTRGIEGLADLRKVDQLLSASMAYRDYQAPGVLKDEDELLGKAGAAAEQIDGLFSDLAGDNRSFDSSGSWKDQVLALQAEWEQLKQDDNYQGNIDPQFKYYHEFVQKVLALLPATIEISGLGQDASRENLLLLGLVRNALPEARTVVGRVRSYGIFALVDGQVGYNLSEILNEIYDQLTNRSSLLSPALSVAVETSPKLSSRAGGAVTRVDESLMALREQLDLNIITPMRLELPWQEFDATVSSQLDYYDSLNDSIFSVVSGNLEQRLQRETGQRRLIVGALIGVMLLVVYLYIGFFMSVRTAINRFSEAARSVAAGDMTAHIQLNNRDELGELTTEFNNMTFSSKILEYNSSNQVNHQS